MSLVRLCFTVDLSVRSIKEHNLDEIKYRYDKKKNECRPIELQKLMLSEESPVPAPMCQLNLLIQIWDPAFYLYKG